MSKPSPQNCWQFKNCPAEKRQSCFAFKLERGKTCWRVVKIQDALNLPESARNSHLPNGGFPNCHDCEWYKLQHP